ncbi:MAG TPA: hypothetical protein VM598_02745 [Bdellovibrionota bacterium]|nr:hypothetical protein [Bdellovibrionota bacterium]
MSDVRMYFPYSELSVEWNPEQTEFLLKCPWVSISVEVEPAERERILRLAAPPFTSDFISCFSEHPVGYPAPRSSAALKRVADERGIAEILRGSELPDLPGMYDPATAYALIRRQRLLAESAPESGANVYESLARLLAKDEQAFFEAAALVLRQTFEVTSHCLWALEPALVAEGLDRAKVKAFRDEERGHEMLVLKSFKDAGFSRADLDHFPVLEETRLSIEALRQAAESVPFAFCCLVGLFEGNIYAEADPLAELFKRSSRPQAASGIQTHFNINRDGGHSRVGEELVADLPAQGRAEIVHAASESARVVELGRKLMSSLVARFAHADL